MFSSKYNKIEVFECRVKKHIKSKLMLYFIDFKSIKISNFKQEFSGKDVSLVRCVDQNKGETRLVNH